jgi:hypothetical protein
LFTLKKAFLVTLQAPPQRRHDVSKRHEASAKRDVSTCVVAPLARGSASSAATSDRRQTYHFDDAFEDEIESQVTILL